VGIDRCLRSDRHCDAAFDRHARPVSLVSGCLRGRQQRTCQHAQQSSQADTAERGYLDHAGGVDRVVMDRAFVFSPSGRWMRRVVLVGLMGLGWISIRQAERTSLVSCSASAWPADSRRAQENFGARISEPEFRYQDFGVATISGDGLSRGRALCRRQAGWPDGIWKHDRSCGRRRPADRGRARAGPRACHPRT